MQQKKIAVLNKKSVQEERERELGVGGEEREWLTKNFPAATDKFSSLYKKSDSPVGEF